MTAPAKARRPRVMTVEVISLHSVLLAFQLVAGILCGYLFSGRCAGELGDELRRYVEGYLSAAASRTVSWEAAMQTLACYFRAPIVAFLLGFASIGVAGIPLLCAVQGFVFSFSLFSFAFAMGREHFLMLPVLFGFRMLFVLPVMFLLASAAFEKSRELAALSLGSGKRSQAVTYGSPYWYRFAVCSVCLLIGCVLELWLLPLFLAVL